MKNKILQIAAVIFIAAFTLGFLAGAVTEFSLSGNNKVVSEVYTVKQGDTFMEICAQYRKRDCREPYIFEYMDEIKALNPKIVERKSQLSPGDKIKIQYREKNQ